MKEDLIRISCVLLGSFFTFGSGKVVQWVDANTYSGLVIVEETESQTADLTDSLEDVLEIDNLNLRVKFEEAVQEEAASEEIQSPETQFQEAQMQDASSREVQNISANQIEEESVAKAVSTNSIETAPVKWKKDYPAVSSEHTLEEKLAERSSYEETLAVNAFDKEIIANSSIDFSDVKISIMGDSITTGVQLTEEDQKKYAYPVVLQEILGCKEVVNLGIGGSSVSSAGNYPMVERWSEFPKDSDIIIIFGGSNDCLFEDKTQFGNVELENRKNLGTFCGDLDAIASSIKTEYGDNNEKYVKFIYINPPSTILNDGVYESDPENKVYQTDFANAINAIVPEYGFEVIDLYNNNILNSRDKMVNEQFVPDGIHPNVEGHRILAEHIASQIIQRIEQ